MLFNFTREQVGQNSFGINYGKGNFEMKFMGEQEMWTKFIWVSPKEF